MSELARAARSRLTLAVLLVLGLARTGAAQTAPVPGVLDGIIVNEAGVVVAGAKVTARLDGIVRASTTTNERGEFALKGMAPGTYAVRIEREQFETMIVQMTAVGDGRGETFDLAASLRQRYDGARAELVAWAAALPALGYSTPIGTTPEEPTFGAQLSTLIGRQLALCSALVDQPAERPGPDTRPTQTKTELSRALARSLAACDEAFERLTDHSATEMVRIGIDHRPRAAVLADVITETSRAAASAAFHLRAKNITPPAPGPVRVR